MSSNNFIILNDLATQPKTSFCMVCRSDFSVLSFIYHSIIPQVFPTVTSCQFPTGSLTGRKGQGLKRFETTFKCAKKNLNMCKNNRQICKTTTKCEKIVLKICKNGQNLTKASTPGTVNIDHALCVLSLNIVNDKIFLIEW